MKPGESMRKKYPNLIPNSERSPEELRKIGRKGGIKSGEARRKKRDQEKMAKMLLQMLRESPEAKENIEELKHGIMEFQKTEIEEKSLKEYLDKIKRPSCCLVGRSFLIIKEIVDNIRRFRPDNREGQSR